MFAECKEFTAMKKIVLSLWQERTDTIKKIRTICDSITPRPKYCHS